jgi:hypothetical protein
MNVDRPRAGESHRRYSMLWKNKLDQNVEQLGWQFHWCFSDGEVTPLENTQLLFV